MPFGAHETMEVHECLMEKINAITHFNLYAKEAKHPQLLDMIARHQQEELRSYNEIVSLTRGSQQFQPVSPRTDIQGVSHQQIQYGLNNPPQYTPQMNTALSDAEIAIAMLLCHKNGARNCSWAALECADPNLRMAMQNSAATCMNQAYEVFLFMNEQGMYQIPTMKDHTTQNFLNSYQPAGSQMEQQYTMMQQQNTGYGGMGMNRGAGMGAGAAANMNPGIRSSQSGMGSMNVGSRDSVLYGNRRGMEAQQSQYQPQYRSSVTSMYGSSNGQGSMPQ